MTFFLCPLILSFFLFWEIIPQALCYKIIKLVTVSFHKLYSFELLLLSRNGFQGWKKTSSKFQFVCIFLFSLSESFFIFFVCLLYSLVCVFLLSFGVILFPFTGSYFMCHCRYIINSRMLWPCFLELFQFQPSQSWKQPETKIELRRRIMLLSVFRTQYNTCSKKSPVLFSITMKTNF